MCDRAYFHILAHRSRLQVDPVFSLLAVNGKSFHSRVLPTTCSSGGLTGSQRVDKLVPFPYLRSPLRQPYLDAPIAMVTDLNAEWDGPAA